MDARKRGLRRTTGAVRAPVAVLAALALLGAGLVLGTVAATPPIPDELVSGQPLTSVALVQRSFADEAEVSVTVVTEGGQTLTAEGAGRITSFACAPGQPLMSGTSLLAIDGRPAVNLSTAVPLWRDLSGGDRGADALALNEELSRLGYAAGPGDTVTWETVAGFQQLRRDLTGDEEPGPEIVRSDVLWLPAETVTAASCTKRVGDVLEQGDTVVELPAGIAGARVSPAGEPGVAGERLLVLGEEEIIVSEDRTISDPDALARIARSPQFAEAEKGERTGTVRFAAKWRLVEPVEASVVPPSALVGLVDGTGCVIADGVPERVTVVGSELGQSFVTFMDANVDADTDVPASRKRIELSPDPQTECG